METLMLVSNPSTRKGVKKMATRKRRTAAQKAATRKMIAANRARRGGRTVSAKKRHASPKRRRRTSVARVQHVMTTKRRRTRRTVSVGRVRRRRNPSIRGGLMGELMSSVMPAVWGAGGAMVINVASGVVMTKVPGIPDALKSGYGKMGVDILLAALLGTFGRKVLGSKASLMASGAMTVIAYNALAPVAAKFLPGLAGFPGQIEGMPGQIEGVGYYSPAQTFGASKKDDDSIGVDGIDYYGDNMSGDEPLSEYSYA